MSAAATARRGIASGGNWIVDRVKTVDRLPARGMLANIRAEARSAGGAPVNVLTDLALLGVKFPLAGYGVIGDDADGAYLAAQLEDLGVDVSALVRAPDLTTSYTDVMNEEGTGDRAFFHRRGANAIFAPEHVPVDALTCRIFHFGYLLLLDRMDEPDAEYGSVAARLLAALRRAGIRTSVDVVSEDSDRFRTIVPPALRHTDYLIINEIEAGRIASRAVRRDDGTLDPQALVASVEDLAKLGDMAVIAVHMPEGAYWRERTGRRASVGALALPPDFIKGAVGAGDAFCAGLLLGLHDGTDATAALHLGCCCASASLSAVGATEGLGPLDEVLALGKRFGSRPPPITI